MGLPPPHQPGWDDVPPPCCAHCERRYLNPTPAGNWWCEACLQATPRMPVADLPAPLLTPDYAVGYRAWKIGWGGVADGLAGVTVHGDTTKFEVNTGHFLASQQGGGDMWVPYERHEARCPRNRLSPCSTRCLDGIGRGCGIYAVREYNMLERRVHMTRPSSPDGVYGVVALWGRMWEHQGYQHGDDGMRVVAGWRAQYAYPQCLYLPRDEEHAAVVRKVAARYGITAEEDPHRRDTADHG